jgi:ATP-dependent 26S proteasome regulatory subunit
VSTEEPAFHPEAPRRTLDDLVVPPRVQDQLDAAMARLRNHETLYREWGLDAVDPRGSAVALNLYGPPGTGKTLCAEGIAGTLGREFLRVSYADLESKYVGDTAKNLVRAFRHAAASRALLFFDEADAVLSRRIALATQSSDHALNMTRSVLLMELDRFDGVVVFATNLVVSYDPAFVRRMFAHVRFELPDRDCRERIWRGLLPERLPREAALQPALLAEESEGLSGGDLLGVLLRAACRAVQREGCERRLSLADVRAELSSVRRARGEVPGLDAAAAPVAALASG